MTLHKLLKKTVWNSHAPWKPTVRHQPINKIYLQQESHHSQLE